jgi:hypothetical protein
LLQGSTFNDLRRTASTYSNRALFEVAMILEKCARKTPAPIQIEAAV